MISILGASRSYYSADRIVVGLENRPTIECKPVFIPWLWFWMDVTVVYQMLYIFITLSCHFLCLSTFCYVMVPHVWMSAQVICLSEILYSIEKCLLWFVPFECEETSVPGWVGEPLAGCCLPARGLSVACEQKWDMWTKLLDIKVRAQCFMTLLTLELYLAEIITLKKCYNWASFPWYEYILNSCSRCRL